MARVNHHQIEGKAGLVQIMGSIRQEKKKRRKKEEMGPTAKLNRKLNLGPVSKPKKNSINNRKLKNKE
jgi:hypothetical protein